METLTIEVQIPVYHGGPMDVFWDSAGELSVEAEKNKLIIRANCAALNSLAKQMLYFACNNLLNGAHVHYDDFFCKNRYSGEMLTLEFFQNEAAYGEELYDSNVLDLRFSISPCDMWVSEQSAPGLLQVVPDECRITADEKAMLFLAKLIMCLALKPEGSVCLVGSDSAIKLILHCESAI